MPRRELPITGQEGAERRLARLLSTAPAPSPQRQMPHARLYYVVAAGVHNPWVRRRKIELAELVSESWVLPPLGSVIGSVVMEAFSASGLDYPRTTVVTESSEVRTSLLTTGRFVTIFPASALKFAARRREIKALPVELPMAPLPNGIVTLKNRALSPVAQLFIDCAREVAKPLAMTKG